MLTLEGMIRDPSGVAALHAVEADDYAAARTQMHALVTEGSQLLWMRRQ